MKNLFIILLSMLSIACLSVQAQTKKPATKTTAPAKKVATVKKPTTKTAAVKKAPAKTTPPSKATSTKTVATSQTKPATVKTEEKVSAKPTNRPVESASTSGYKAAVGLKFIYGVSLTGKFFINQNNAIEGILRYNTAGGLGNNIGLTGLYEHHTAIKSVEGLQWYVGGGGFATYFSYKGQNTDPVTTFGIAGAIGLEYKFSTLPLAISADWLPGYFISNDIGFSAENGGIGVKYTF